MIRRLILLVYMLSCCWAGLGIAADRESKYAMFGVGRTKCDQFLTHATDLDFWSDFAWIAGYLTTINNWTPDTYSILETPSDDLTNPMDWLTDYCRLNPMRNVATAMEVYVRQHSPTRQTRAPSVKRELLPKKGKHK